MSSLQYEGSLPSGMKFEIHTMASFSGMEEIAVIVEGKPVTIITVTRRKGGNVEVKPVLNSKMMFMRDKGEVPELTRESVVKPRIIED